MSQAVGFDALWRQWHAELRSKPLLRLGVLGIVGILWLYGLLVLDDAVRARQLALQSQQALFDGLAQDAQDERVFEWRQRMAGTLEAYRALATREVSEGVLQAAFSDDIRRVLLEHGLKVMELAVDLLPPPTDPDWPGELRLIRARVIASGPRQAVLRSWAALLEQRPGRQFESVTLGSADTGTVEWEMAELCAIDTRGTPP